MSRVSHPASGSVSAKAPTNSPLSSLGSNLPFISSEANGIKSAGMAPTPGRGNKLGHIFDTSSDIIANNTGSSNAFMLSGSSPIPSVWNFLFISISSSLVNGPSLSRLSTMGAYSRCIKSRRPSLNIRCSSVNSKSI